MSSKILASVAAVAVLALWGCASAPMIDSSAPFNCTSNTCEVPVGLPFMGSIVAQDIQVNADPQTIVRITFVVNSWIGAHFPPDGITVDSNFQCNLEAGSTTRILCTGTNLRRGGSYKYTARLRAGILTPWPLDPFIKN